jgi:hypothetical protein
MKHLGGDGSPLHLPLASLDLNRKFTVEALEHGFNTLYDFQKMTIADLLELDWFTAAMFRDLTKVLKTLHKLVSS